MHIINQIHCDNLMLYLNSRIFRAVLTLSTTAANQSSIFVANQKHFFLSQPLDAVKLKLKQQHV